MEATWELFELISQQFPFLYVLDKVTELGGYLISLQLNLLMQDAKRASKLLMGKPITWQLGSMEISRRNVELVDLLVSLLELIEKRVQIYM